MRSLLLSPACHQGLTVSKMTTNLEWQICRDTLLVFDMFFSPQKDSTILSKIVHFKTLTARHKLSYTSLERPQSFHITLVSLAYGGVLVHPRVNFTVNTEKTFPFQQVNMKTAFYRTALSVRCHIFIDFFKTFSWTNPQRAMWGNVLSLAPLSGKHLH